MKKRFIVTLASGAFLSLVLWKLSSDPSPQSPVGTPQATSGHESSSPQQVSTPELAEGDNPEMLQQVTGKELAEFQQRNLTSVQKERLDLSKRFDVQEVQKVVWLDPASERSRRRIRFVKANFKYPNLLFEEVVTTDPDTGETIVRTTRSAVADHLTVGLNDNVDPSVVAEALQGLGYTIRKQRPYYLIAELQNYTAPNAHEINIAKIEKNLPNLVKFADYDNLRYSAATFPNDPRFSEVYGLDNTGQTGGTSDADIDAPEAWDTRSSAADIVVAVVDTGIRRTHQDLSANIWTNPTNPSEWGIDAVDGDPNPDDEQGHGTHVAGTIGAVGNNGLGVTGVAWDVQLMTCRVLGADGTGTNSDIVDGYEYARTKGAHLINASLGGPQADQLAFEAIQRCLNDNMVFVAAAGNDAANNDTTGSFPANYDLGNIVSVAAINHDDALATFSNYGATKVDIAGHGVDILSTSFTGDDKYELNSGTSMATPQVAGAVALAYAQFPGAGYSEIIARLYGFSTPIPSLNGKIATGSKLNLNLLLNGTLDVDNDNFADAITIPDLGGSYTIIDMNIATREQFEDELNLKSDKTGSHSAWYQWTAPHTGKGMITTTATTGPALATLFLGDSIETLEKVYSTTDIVTSSPKKSYTFPISFEAGQVFTIMMDAKDTTTTNQGSISLVVYPDNDHISNAIVVTDPAFSTNGNNSNATIQHFEIDGSRDAGAIDHGFGSGISVWWKWRAPFTGNTTISASGPQGVGVAVYKGWPLTAGGTKSEGPWIAVTEESTAGDTKSFEAKKGTIYYIVVDSTNPGDITLTNTPSVSLLSINTVGNGSLSQSLSAPQYYTGDIVEFTPSAAPGWSFAGWQGIDSVDTTTGVASVTMATDRTVTAVFEQTLDAWKELHFGSELAASINNYDDPDKDGLTNLQEYLHGSDPLNASDNGKVESHLTDDCLCIIYWKNIGAVSPLNIVPEHSSNMSDWLSEGITEEVLESTSQRVKIKAMLPMEEGENGFIRLNYVE
ncbi:Subtilase family protein [Rubritalea squalenifaciens DSM 18772]|uniref:Subtilase family protein n=1 Tax=Rubritalea squalenifaciens DSM 18772 TaxID=1123071 RepID=A0A1M6KQL0_9BACT|nr:S8 family serine peptidase [Rubritalea squalenifaciens]SHJ61227.1 Subtilase family protein [Rubritalea squalenifaciens DSM 18772]